MPAGILGSGFALKVQAMQRQKHLNRRRAPAASLIQSLWRCYAAAETSLSVTSIKKRVTNYNANETKSSALKDLLRNQMQHQQNLSGQMSPGENKKDANSSSPCDSTNGNSFSYALQNIENTPEKKAQASQLESSPHKSYNSGKIFNLVLSLDEPSVKNLFVDIEENADGVMKLNHKQKVAIRALRKIKYFVARRKFREALRPYDVTDVIEQYSAGNLDMLSRIKSLQFRYILTFVQNFHLFLIASIFFFRLDKILGSSKEKDCYDTSCVSLATRIMKVEQQVIHFTFFFFI